MKAVLTGDDKISDLGKKEYKSYVSIRKGVETKKTKKKEVKTIVKKIEEEVKIILDEVDDIVIEGE